MTISMLAFRNSFLILILAASAAHAGPLNPPPGPITSTAKPLAEVEPRIAINTTNTPGDANSLFKITQPGSYYLTGNITGVAGKHGIEIGIGSVVLDLNGFAVINSGTGLDGVTTDGLAQVSITVRNGVVSAWGDSGIELAGTGHLLENIHTRVNRMHGIVIGANATVRACQSSGNLARGIYATGDGAAISHCAAASNGTDGVRVASGASIASTTASNNTGVGIVAADAATLTNCTADSSTLGGIQVAQGSSVTGCVATANGSTGLFAGGGSTLVGCSALGNGGPGFQLGSNGTISHCTASNNSGAGFNLSGAAAVSGCQASGNSSSGFTGFDSCLFSNCSGTSNAARGFDTGARASVTNCAANSNGLDGFRIGSTSLLVGSSAALNGADGDGSGIRVVGGDCRVDGNFCSGNDAGIRADFSGSLFVRNTCANNALNWDLASGNQYGPIIDRSSAAPAAVSGNAASSGLGAPNEPFANFTF